MRFVERKKGKKWATKWNCEKKAQITPSAIYLHHIQMKEFRTKTIRNGKSCSSPPFSWWRLDNFWIALQDHSIIYSPTPNTLIANQHNFICLHTIPLTSSTCISLLPFLYPPSSKWWRYILKKIANERNRI